MTDDSTRTGRLSSTHPNESAGPRYEDGRPNGIQSGRLSGPPNTADNIPRNKQGYRSSRERRYPKTIAVDFDGVLNSYVSGWQEGKLLDPPLKPEHSTTLYVAEDAFEWLHTILETDVTVIIFTCRTNASGMGDLTGGPYTDRLVVREQIKDWFLKHGLEHKYVNRLQFALDVKPHADLYLDDRAWQFSGHFPTYDEIENFRPWQRRTTKEVTYAQFHAQRQAAYDSALIQELQSELDTIPPWVVGAFGLLSEIKASGGLVGWFAGRKEPRT